MHERKLVNHAPKLHAATYRQQTETPFDPKQLLQACLGFTVKEMLSLTLVILIISRLSYVSQSRSQVLMPIGFLYLTPRLVTSTVRVIVPSKTL